MTIALLLLAGAITAEARDDLANRPVSKVITLLKDMTSQLEKEGKEDEEIYETYYEGPQEAYYSADEETAPEAMNFDDEDVDEFHRGLASPWILPLIIQDRT